MTSMGITQAVAAAVAGIALTTVPHAASAASAPIFSCTDASGRKLTSDRLIPECLGRNQRVLNADGSVNRIVPPSLTAEERADMEERERQEAAARSARSDAIRRDRNLVARYPNEAAHRLAREKALDDVRSSMRLSEARVALLTKERKPLDDEAEFYIGKPIPAKLKRSLDANDASLAAQRALIQNREQEIVRINAIYDAELAHLRKLWGGAPAASNVPAGTPVPARVGFR